MPRKPTTNRSSSVGGATWVPVVPIDYVIVVDGETWLTVSIEFTEGSAPSFRSRIAASWGPWRSSRSEALRDMHDLIGKYMHGRPWTRERDYTVRALDL